MVLYFSCLIPYNLESSYNLSNELHKLFLPPLKYFRSYNYQYNHKRKNIILTILYIIIKNKINKIILNYSNIFILNKCIFN